MSRAALRTPAPRYLVLLTTGSLFLYGANSRQGRIRLDTNSAGDSELKWPRAKATVLGQQRLSDLQQSANSIRSKEQEVQDAISPKPSETPLLKNEDSAAWRAFSSNFAKFQSTVLSIEWSSLGDKIRERVVPEWTKFLPGYVTKLQREMDMAPGSLADEIWDEASDLDLNPEIARDATVNIGKELCPEEKEFRRRRKQHTTKALAKYLHIPEEEIDPEDVPTIAICGSGGGLRALVAGTGSYLCAQEAGLFDCVTYTAGVSGSCWLQALYHSSLAGQRHEKLVKHLKKRIGVHIAFLPTALSLLTTAPTNKFLLSGFVEKLKGDPAAEFGLVDVYGVLLASRLLVPNGELGVNDQDLKLSNQRQYVDDGLNPLPIYSAVRHEIPIEEKASQTETTDDDSLEKVKKKAQQESWFQWFEFTPYELWCEELSAGIPSWSIGRHFRNGRNTPISNDLNLPELRLPLLLGIWGSAFCATLSHYYKEIRPFLSGLSGFGNIDELISDRNDDLIRVHPVAPASIPNYALGLERQLPPSCPRGIFSSSHLQLMDAGMSNNLPIYPLLRPGRDIDIIVAFDASADVKKENWLGVADEYAQNRGIKGWPAGAGWPQTPSAKSEINEALHATSAQEAAGKIADAREAQRERGTETSETLASSNVTDSADLGPCTVWVGNTAPSSAPSVPITPESNFLSSTESLAPALSHTAGLVLVYFPLLPHSSMPDIDPDKSEFMSTWNFVYTPEEIDSVVGLARANFKEGEELTRETVRTVYERRKRERLEMEKERRSRQWWKRAIGVGDLFR
ncbi:hypothetical protein MMC20_001618 [Loxospora ochrophaea]|nr:hypothetical protein [Loxospora ochrophaea]